MEIGNREKRKIKRKQNKKKDKEKNKEIVVWAQSSGAGPPNPTHARPSALFPAHAACLRTRAKLH
jgi:hypothetical protein